MSNSELILLLVNGFVVLAAAGLFVRFLCDEYRLMLELHGLIRPRAAQAPARKPETRP